MTSRGHEMMWAELPPYYDVIYQWKDYRGESRRIEDLIGKHKKTHGKELLAVACGTGGHLQYLRKCFKATGIDASQQMLREARKKCPGVALRQDDMMSFQINRCFDAIICLFSSIAYVRTDRNLKKTIKHFGDQLNPGGVLIIEPFLTRETFFTGEIDGGTMSGDGIKISRLNVSRRRGNVAILDFHFLVATKSGVRHLRDLHELGLFDVKRFLEHLRGGGLRARFLKNGLMKDRGLYLAVKR